jgi:2-(3-amino-3-carboxypropyl)histidine synthase
MLETGNVLKKLKRLRARRVFIQVPEGLKTWVLDFARELESAGLKAYISAEPCFGACDIRDREARSLGCDVLLHIGHSDYGVKACLPVIYEEYRMDADPTPFLRDNLAGLKGFERICLLTTVQYLSGLGKAAEFLKAKGKKVFLGSPNVASYPEVHRYPGQILGCDYSAAKAVEPSVDCFLFIGTGGFHPLGLAMETEKPVLFLDIENGELVDLAKERFRLLKVRYARIAKAGEARNFGILVSTKPGQSHPRLAEQAKEKLESMGRRAWILVADQITPGQLLGLNIEALVNTACPRIREDARQFRKPIISVEDIDMLEEQSS